jgi:anti-anti-sigma factor
MDFLSRFYGDTIIFKPKNVLLDELGTIRFKRELMTALGKGEIKRIIINLSTVKMTDSTGLAALLFARRYSLGKEGECILVFPSAKILNQLKLSKLTPSFKIIEKEDEYLALKKELEESLNIPLPSEEEEEEQEELAEEEDNGQDKLIFTGTEETAVPTDEDFSFEE